ncbi:MAG: DUF6484 domain-containing protein [Kiloniellales bacterium]|nr:DUF6484 domain-containing protein [Kiloniellales bacterium]
MSSLKERRSSKTEDRAAGAPRLPQVVIGRLVALAPEGTPQVDFPGNPEDAPLAALSAAAIGPDAVGQEVALLFADGDPRRPFVVGLLREPAPAEAEAEVVTGPGKPTVARVDGEQVVIAADKEIVLKCGRASITLTRAGKVLIRGAYLLSRSSGVNRVKGGSVQIN